MRFGIALAIAPLFMLISAGCAQQAAKQEAQKSPPTDDTAEQTWPHAYIMAISSVAGQELIVEAYHNHCSNISLGGKSRKILDNVHREWLERNKQELQEIQPYLNASPFYEREDLLGAISARIRENGRQDGVRKSLLVCATQISKINNGDYDIANAASDALSYLRSGAHEVKIHYPKDTALAGKWAGKREGIEGCQDLYWDIDRKESGEYTAVFFSSPTKGKSIAEIQGTWWVSGKRYFERTQNIRAVDIYQYQVTDPDIHYEMLEAGNGADCDVANYTFSDNPR